MAQIQNDHAGDLTVTGNVCVSSVDVQIVRRITLSGKNGYKMAQHRKRPGCLPGRLHLMKLLSSRQINHRLAAQPATGNCFFVAVR